ncbi:hypothetical protein BDV26DRAFT_59146 [Aspergillus bertholletiae]|uniref:Uncharacterized protein n=1 Tax=Aspergillus bertholletiae TaxID=1226010 RepID=A0A5N7AXI3_9EURO|nr:hypothetical protein BDV26DRAFT_59146 [Aspergillus bertholletiae]
MVRFETSALYTIRMLFFLLPLYLVPTSAWIYYPGIRVLPLRSTFPINKYG